MLEIKELNKEQIDRANNNSLSGKRGDGEESDYKIYCDRVISWGLSERKTQKIIDKVYDYFSRSLSLASQHVSVAVAGGSNYNAKRLDKSDRIIENAADFCEWFNNLEDQANRKSYSRIALLTKEIIWGVNGEYSTTSQWKELAGRSRKDFDILFEELSKKHEFKKTSIPYKIYHNILDVEKIERETIYKDGDFCAYKEQGKIFIDFRLKPARQLIVALKARRFSWVSACNAWRATASDELTEWVKTISDRYEQYI